MPPRTDVILFLDTECTGSDKKTEDIVQIAVVALGAPSWAEVGFFNHPIVPSEAGWNRMMSNDIVREMHEKSGLMRWLRQAKANYPERATPEAVDDMLIKWLNKEFGTDTSHIPYGGHGVNHFDRPFIDRQLPRFSKRITYKALDVGSVQWHAQLAGRTDWPVQNEDEKHDALADARFHAREFRFALTVLSPWENGVRRVGPWEGRPKPQ